jgi:hypothetical protein
MARSRKRAFAIREAEWLACTQSTDMLGWLSVSQRASEADLRRFGAACCRRIWEHLVDERSRRAVELAEIDVEGRLGAEERLAAAQAAAAALAEARRNLDIHTNGHVYHAAWAAALCLATPEVPLPTPTPGRSPEISGAFDRAVHTAVNSAYAAAISRVIGIPSKSQMHAQLEVECDAEYAAQADLIRAIFAYPFGPTKAS